MGVTYIGQNDEGDGFDTLNAAYRTATKVSNSAGAGTITEIGISMHTCYTPFNLKLAIYADSSGSPGALLYDAGVLAVSTTGWNTKSSLTYSIAAGATIWIAQLCDVGGEANHNYTGGTSTFMYLGSSSYASFPYDPFGAGTLTNGVACVRAGVTAASGNILLNII